MWNTRRKDTSECNLVAGWDYLKTHNIHQIVILLMSIMPVADDPESLRPLFQQMRGWFDRLRDENIDNVSMDVLSMGMSGDCIIAAEEGATLVRLGRALFGARN